MAKKQRYRYTLTLEREAHDDTRAEEFIEKMYPGLLEMQQLIICESESFNDTSNGSALNRAQSRLKSRDFNYAVLLRSTHLHSKNPVVVAEFRHVDGVTHVGLPMTFHL